MVYFRLVDTKVGIILIWLSLSTISMNAKINHTNLTDTVLLTHLLRRLVPHLQPYSQAAEHEKPMLRTKMSEEHVVGAGISEQNVLLPIFQFQNTEGEFVPNHKLKNVSPFPKSELNIGNTKEMVTLDVKLRGTFANQSSKAYFRASNLKNSELNIGNTKEMVTPDVKLGETFTNKSSKAYFRASNLRDSMQEFIKKKVESLKPLLQDDTVPDDRQLTLEGEDETTIIELDPQLKVDNNHYTERKMLEKNTKNFQDNIEKYKKLRNKIGKALKREHVSNKTKILITTTLDKMIAEMIGHKCVWENGAKYKGKMLSSDKNKQKGPAGLFHSWSEMLAKIKKEYLKNSSNPIHSKDSRIQQKFLNKFHDLMSVITSDLNSIVNKYKLVCRFADLYEKFNSNMQTKFKSAIRTDEGNKEKLQKYLKTNAEREVKVKKLDGRASCTNFKICSDELKDFIYDFYISLNHTAITTIQNYASMFLRDVSDDIYHEKERIVGLINETSLVIEKKIHTHFIKKTKKLEIDGKKNQFANIKLLYNFINRITRQIRKSVHKEIVKGLKDVRGKLVDNIQKDIDVNLDMDVGNLEREVNDRMCPSFETCNGKIFNARRGNYVKDKKSVYVKLLLNLNDENDLKVANRPRENKFRVSLTKSPSKFSVTRTAPSISHLILNINATSDNNKKHIENSKKSNDGETDMTISNIKVKLNMLDGNTL